MQTPAEQLFAGRSFDEIPEKCNHKIWNELVDWMTGWTPSTEIWGHAIPKMPSNLAITKVTPGSLVASANSWLFTQILDTQTVSLDIKPGNIMSVYLDYGWFILSTTFHRTRSILDLHCATILFIRRWLCAIVFVMQHWN